MAEKRTGSLATSRHVPGVRQALIDTEVAMPSFRRPGEAEEARARHLERYSHGEPYYCTRACLRSVGIDLAGDPHEWLVVDADDNVRRAPTDHFPDLTDEQRRRMSSCGSYYPPPDESEADHG